MILNSLRKLRKSIRESNHQAQGSPGNPFGNKSVTYSRLVKYRWRNYQCNALVINRLFPGAPDYARYTKDQVRRFRELLWSVSIPSRAKVTKSSVKLFVPSPAYPISKQLWCKFEGTFLKQFNEVYSTMRLRNVNGKDLW